MVIDAYQSLGTRVKPDVYKTGAEIARKYPRGFTAVSDLRWWAAVANHLTSPNPGPSNMDPSEPQRERASDEPAGLDAPQTNFGSQSESQPRKSLGGLVPFGCGTVIALCLLANVLVPGVFWDMPLGSNAEYLALFLAGSLVAQIGMIALWCAVGLGSFRWRLLGTSLLSLLIACSFLVGLRLPEPDSMPFSVAIFFVSIGLIGFLLTVGAFSVLGRLTGERLTLPDRLPVFPHQTAQSYSIGYLIGFTTLVAIVIAVLQAVLPPASEDQAPSARELLLTCILVGLHSVLSIGVVLSCSLLVLRARGNAVGLVALTSCFLIGVPLDLGLLQFLSENEFLFPDGLPWMLAYTVGLACTSIVFLLLVRSCGLRLARWAAASPTEPGSPE